MPDTMRYNAKPAKTVDPSKALTGSRGNVHYMRNPAHLYLRERLHTRLPFHDGAHGPRNVRISLPVFSFVHGLL